VKYIPFLSSVHQLVKPEHYLEIGIRNGTSLVLSTCRSVGIDPAYSLTAELNTHVTLFRTTSDEYFSRPSTLAVTDGEPFDLTFIDGMHLFEFALRDFINTERNSRRTSVIVFDDVLPRTVDEAARERHTNAWTGDVYPIIDVLAQYRPDVATILVDTEPTGLFLVVGLDPASTVLADNYEEIMREYRHADPQPVPEALLNRVGVQSPQRVLDAQFWKVLAEERTNAAGADFARRLRHQLAADFGPRYDAQPGQYA